MTETDAFDLHPGLHIGVVVDRADPEALGRVRVRIPGLIEPASSWAFPLGTVGGGSAGRGFLAVPEVGAEVGVLFHQGDVDHPFYLAGHWGKPDGQPEVPTPVRDAAAAEAPAIRAFETPRYLLVFDDREGAPALRLIDKATGDEVALEPAGIAVRSATAVRVDAPEVVLQGTARVMIDSAEVVIAGGGPAAARAGDPVAPTPGFAAWISAVTALCNSMTPFSVPPHAGGIGEIASGSGRVTVG